MPDALATFVRARTAEDVAVALAAPQVWGEQRWQAVRSSHSGEAYLPQKDYDKHAVATGNEDGSVLLTSPWDEMQVVEHAARHDPARILRRAEGDLRVVTNFERIQPGGHGYGAARYAVVNLALGHSDHPDFNAAAWHL